MAGWPENDPDWNSLLTEQWRHNGRLLFRLAYGLLRDREAARDVCQDAMLKACQRRRDLKDARKIKSWLAQIVVNESLQLCRRSKVQQRVLVLHQSSVREAASAAGPAASPSVEERREKVFAAMEQLSDKERLIVALRYMEGLSGNEVKDLLGCSAGEVSKQLNRGAEALRVSLSDWRMTAERESNVL